jgi:hypothetical protein
MGDDGAPGGGGDPQSAAVRLLRSVAPWTAPNSEAPAASPPSQPSAAVPSRWGTAGAGPTDRGQVDKSINGSGFRIGSFITFGFLFLVALGNSDSSVGDDGSIRVRWWAVVLALMGVWLAWTWTRRQAAKRSLRQVGMRAGAVVTSVNPPIVAGLVGQSIQYRYETKGQPRRGHATLGRGDRQLKQGDHIAIFYDISNPDVSLM